MAQASWEEEAAAALGELLSVAGLRPGQVVVVGGSTSEIQGRRIGSSPDLAVGQAVMRGLGRVAAREGVHLAIQCCEHLNRALVVPEEVAERRNLTVVSAYPVPGAGGALAAAAMEVLPGAVLVESIQAEAGLDIGLTLIGMHLRPVVVPVRLHQARVGEALVVGARTRPKLIGGERARYRPPDKVAREEAAACHD